MTRAQDKVLRVQQHITQRLIDYSPTTITLMRPLPAQDDGAGGRLFPTGSANSVAQPSRERFFAPKSPKGTVRAARGDFRATEHSTDVGEFISQAWTLLGPAGDDIRKHDWFVVGGNTYTVTFVDPDQRYEVRAEAERYVAAE